MRKYLSSLLLILPLALGISTASLTAAEKKKDSKGSITAYFNTAYNSEKGLSDEHKQRFTQSKDFPVTGYGFGLEAALKAVGFRFGVGFTYDISKKVDSIDKNGRNWGYVKRQDIQVYDSIARTFLKGKVWKTGLIVKPGVNIRTRMQLFDGQEYPESKTKFSLPMGAYFEIGKQWAAQLETLYDPVAREFKANIGIKYNFQNGKNKK